MAVHERGSENGERLFSTDCKVEDRYFKIDLLKFANGGYVNISESSQPRIGTIVVCIKTPQGVSSTNLLPEKRGVLAANLVGEIVADKTSGIAIVSIYLKGEVNAEITKTLLNEVRTLSQK